jgi:hypothetical protein
MYLKYSLCTIIALVRMDEMSGSLCGMKTSMTEVTDAKRGKNEALSDGIEIKEKQINLYFNG